MKLKILVGGLIFLVFAINCKESVFESESLTPRTQKLKSAAIGTTYYVAKTGNDANAGTLLSPYLTIQKGVNSAAAGDTVFVKGGTYNEYVTFNASGTVGNPIVLKNYGSDGVTVDGASTNIYCLYATNKANLVVDGINVLNSTNYNILMSGCANVTLKNLKSTLSLGSGAINIDMEASTTSWGTNITLQDVTTYGGAIGAYFRSQINGVSIIRGHYTYASLDGINIVGATIADSANYVRNFVIDGSETSYNSRQGIITWCVKNGVFKNFWSHHNAATGIQIENYSSNILLEDFLCEDNSQVFTFESGVWVDDSDGVIVRRGIMRNNQTGFRVSGSRNVLAYNLLIYSNQDGNAAGMINASGVNFYSFPLNDPSYPSLYQCNVQLYNSVIDHNSISSSQRGSVVLQGEGTYTLKNCIISNDQSPYDIYRTGTHTLISDNNLFYNTRALSIYNLNGAVSLSSYKSGSGQDAHSINGDPLFVSTANFQLQSLSPAINNGTNIGLTSDFLGNPIISLPDIGAYESAIAVPPLTTYYNKLVTATTTKNDCGTGYTGSTVTYSVAANKYSSTVSQADADAKAAADLSANKQTYANANGTCTQIPVTVFYNIKMSATATKNNCGTGYTGSTVTYTVAAGKYSSTISQTDANAKASADLTVNKQTYANTYGTCTLIKKKR